MIKILKIKLKKNICKFLKKKRIFKLFKEVGFAPPFPKFSKPLK